MGKRIASLYADISADTTKLKKGLDETKTQLQKTDLKESVRVWQRAGDGRIYPKEV